MNRGGVMAGDGVYREASETQHGATASGFALIAPAIDDARIDAEGPPVLYADFGAAQGNNSLEPMRRADHFFVQLSGDEESRSRYADQSARDWADFLAARSAELAPGASVVVVDVLMDADGVMGSEALFNFLNDALVRCRDDGGMAADEFARIAYPTWFRSLADLRAPFTPAYVATTGARLELVEVQPVVEDDPFRGQFDDPQAYARSQVAFLRGFLEPSFSASLDPGRTPSERAAVLEAVWERATDAIAADPRAVSPSYRLVALRIRRMP